MPFGIDHLTGWAAPTMWSSARPSTLTLTVSSFGANRARGGSSLSGSDSVPPFDVPTTCPCDENCQWSIRKVSSVAAFQYISFFELISSTWVRFLGQCSGA